MGAAFPVSPFSVSLSYFLSFCLNISNLCLFNPFSFLCLSVSVSLCHFILTFSFSLPFSFLPCSVSLVWVTESLFSVCRRVGRWYQWSLGSLSLQLIPGGGTGLGGAPGGRAMLSHGGSQAGREGAAPSLLLVTHGTHEPVSACKCEHVFMHVCACLHVCAYLYTCIRGWVCMCSHVCSCACMCACMCVDVNMCGYMCAHACVLVCVHGRRSPWVCFGVSECGPWGIQGRTLTLTPPELRSL